MVKNTKAARETGFSVIEVVMVLVISIITTAMALPLVARMINNYRLRAAVSSVTWAIQSTRFQALEEGYPFQVAFTGTSSGSTFVNPTYQIGSEPVGTSTFSNVGTSVPVSGSPIVLSALTTLQFKPNGSVSATTGALTFTLTYQGTTETITVSNYGNISVTP